MKPAFYRFFYLLIALAIVCHCELLHAQKIYLLIAADIHDKKIGTSTHQDLWLIHNVFVRQVVRTRLEICRSDDDGTPTWTKPNSDLDNWREPGLTTKANLKEAIFSAINSCPAERNDTIVFYWSGHGSYDEQGHYLIMPDHHPCSRSKVIDHIERKQCRLAVVLTDCCHEYLDRELLPKMEPRTLPPPERTSVLFRLLFFRSRGLVEMNASSRGEYALCVPTGGLFTLALASMTPMDAMKFNPGRRGMDVEQNKENSPRDPYGLFIEDDNGERPAPPPVDQGISPAYGVFYRYAEDNLSWSTLRNKIRTQVQQAFSQLHPNGFYDNNRKKRYTTQTVDSRLQMK